MKFVSQILFPFLFILVHQLCAFPQGGHLVLCISSAPISSLPLAPISPVSANSMTAFSPGIKLGSEDQQTYSHKKMLIPLVIICATLIAIILFVLCLWILHRTYSHKSRKRSTAQSSDAEKGLASAPLTGKLNFAMIGKKGSVSIIDYKLLEKVTNNFGDSNLLGEGGFGRVYKAELDENLHVAVKKLETDGSDPDGEFENELDLLSKIQHPNIISLMGCSIYGEAKFIVYEIMENGSLENQLHGPTSGSGLTWLIRMKIALDIAKGLECLHEHCNPPVIHRDLKSSNILLDANFNAKLSDFGLAVTDGAKNKNNKKLSGTPGYLAPEYLSDGKLTEKSDVYAFGVMLLELLLGRKPLEKMSSSQCQSIVTWAMPQLTDRSKLPNIVDPVIRNTMDLKQLYQVAAVAVLCVQPEPSYRPLITDVLHSLIPLVPVKLGGTLRSPQHLSSDGPIISSGS